MKVKIYDRNPYKPTNIIERLCFKPEDKQGTPFTTYKPVLLELVTNNIMMGIQTQPLFYEPSEFKLLDAVYVNITPINTYVNKISDYSCRTVYKSAVLFKPEEDLPQYKIYIQQLVNYYFNLHMTFSHICKYNFTQNITRELFINIKDITDMSKYLEYQTDARHIITKLIETDKLYILAFLIEILDLDNCAISQLKYLYTALLPHKFLLNDHFKKLEKSAAHG